MLDEFRDDPESRQFLTVGGLLTPLFSFLVSWYSACSGAWDLLLVVFGCFAPGPHME